MKKVPGIMKDDDEDFDFLNDEDAQEFDDIWQDLIDEMEKLGERDAQ